MKKTLIAFTISSCFLFACNNSNDSTGREAAIVPDSSLQQNTATSVSSAPAEMPSTINSGTTETPAAALPSSPRQAAPVAAGMNPAHGEPNHRCDIPVGAPLNSAPAKTASTAPATPVTPSISPAPPGAPGNASVTAAPTTTAPGMNPPHGQPGHDCAIPVGAPLKK